MEVPSKQVVLLHEETSHWTAELERQLAGQGTEFRWCPYFADLLAESVLTVPRVMLLNGRADDLLLERLQQARGGAPSAGIVLVVEMLDDEWEWVARELGADVVLDAAVAQQRVVTAVQRLLDVNA